MTGSLFASLRGKPGPSGLPDRVWKEIRARKAEEILISGHEPLLSTLVAFLLGCDELLVRMKKGALVAVEAETEDLRPHGTLNWMVTSKLAGK